jgi:hypothetical protein
MASAPKERGFWTTLPGIMTGGAALVTALTGLLLGLLQYGMFDPGANRAGEPPPAAAGVSAVEAQKDTPPASVSPSGAASQTAEPTVTLTARDGNATTVYLDGFRHGTTGEELHLQGGQTIALVRISSIDVTRVSQNQARVSIELVDGRTVEGSIDAGLSIHSFYGENDLGRFVIRVADLAHVAFGR